MKKQTVTFQFSKCYLCGVAVSCQCCRSNLLALSPVRTEERTEVTAKDEGVFIIAFLKFKLSITFYCIFLSFTCKSLFKHSDWLFLAARWRALKPGITVNITGIYKQSITHVLQSSGWWNMSLIIKGSNPNHRWQSGLLLERWWPPDSPAGRARHRGGTFRGEAHTQK